MGVTYIALFPFDIHLRDVSVRPHTVRGDRPLVRAYWPHWNEESDGRMLAIVRSTAIPSAPGTRFFRLPPAELHVEVKPGQQSRFANAMRVDFADDATDVEQATAVVQRLLRHLRVLTRQWWIGHAHRDGEGLIRAGYRINGAGELASRDCIVGASIEPRLGCERILEPGDFQAGCAATAAGDDPPAHWEAILDAVYFSIHRGDLRRALLDACIACDMAVIYESIRAGQSIGKAEQIVRRALSDRDLLINLRQGLARLFGPDADYSRTQPAEYELLRQLWAARGVIAHGQVPVVGAGRARLPERAEAAAMIQAALELIERLARLPQ